MILLHYTTIAVFCFIFPINFTATRDNVYHVLSLLMKLVSIFFSDLRVSTSTLPFYVLLLYRLDCCLNSWLYGNAHSTHPSNPITHTIKCYYIFKKTVPFACLQFSFTGIVSLLSALYARVFQFCIASNAYIEERLTDWMIHIHIHTHTHTQARKTKYFLFEWFDTWSAIIYALNCKWHSTQYIQTHKNYLFMLRCVKAIDKFSNIIHIRSMFIVHCSWI